ncbi:uncharacterized protein IL334_002307 [Kwoniella shivajii]|uniref:RING-type domain-containing protein n=1 Tax=Kwoniella shivajii TaxID=564305 RepID=A0ABZ1CUC9_9TREE|nr:hypothetical protein IL334_002307 [Kwoniella shivajii]
MLRSLGSHSSTSSLGEYLLDLPPGPYHTSDDLSDNGSSIQLLDQIPEHLQKNTNEDNPIMVDSSDDEDQAGPSDQARIVKKRYRDALTDEDQPPFSRSRRSSYRSHKKRRKLKDIAPFPPTPKLAEKLFHPPSPIAGPSRSPSTPRSYRVEDHLSHVLEVLPDIDCEWAMERIEEEMAIKKNDDPLNRVVEIALEMEGGYPKIKLLDRGRGMGKEEKSLVMEGSKERYKSLVYKKIERSGHEYHQQCIAQLEEDFPLIPAHHIRNTLYSLDVLYVPTYFRLLENSRLPTRPYIELKRQRMQRKGKNRLIAGSQEGGADSDARASDGADDSLTAFEDELVWLQITLAEEKVDMDAAEAKRLALQEPMEGGEGIECGCCFTETLMEDMAQCIEGHLFCRECTTTHAETKLGEQSTTINCMDMSACSSPFPDSELTRILSVKSLKLYHRLKQSKELEQAGIEGLESCPNCPYAAVMENPDEKLFTCMNEECGQITCRGCKKREHIPRTCAEVEADLKLNNRHTVEDAMSEALIRKCPTCSKPYIKDSGCNKIMCTKCSTYSCYICQKAITGYDHFDQNPERAHNDEAARAARDAAAARVLAVAQENGVALNAEDIHIPLPDPPAASGIAGGAIDMARLPPYIAPIPDRYLARHMNDMQRIMHRAAVAKMDAAIQQRMVQRQQHNNLQQRQQYQLQPGFNQNHQPPIPPENIAAYQNRVVLPLPARALRLPPPQAQNDAQARAGFELRRINLLENEAEEAEVFAAQLRIPQRPPPLFPPQLGLPPQALDRMLVPPQRLAAPDPVHLLNHLNRQYGQ